VSNNNKKTTLVIHARFVGCVQLFAMRSHVLIIGMQTSATTDLKMR